VETFREQSQSINLQNKPIQAISDIRIKASLQKAIQKSFTLNMLYPFIDVIHITKNKELSGIYLKDEPLNIVNQAVQSSIAYSERMKKSCNNSNKNVLVSMFVYQRKCKVQKVIVLMAKSIRLENTVNFIILKSQIFTLIVVSQENL